MKSVVILQLYLFKEVTEHRELQAFAKGEDIQITTCRDLGFKMFNSFIHPFIHTSAPNNLFPVFPRITP